jgi:hypothetical protein
MRGVAEQKAMERLRVYERIQDKDNKDRGSSLAMPSPYYLYYMRILMMVKQRIIESDAKPELWNRLKRNTLVM